MLVENGTWQVNRTVLDATSGPKEENTRECYDGEFYVKAWTTIRDTIACKLS